ncbi:uncharacterized protein ACNLHF_024709 [Anomaloglossus baeobatrachus]
METSRRRAPALVLCLLLRNVFGQFAEHEARTVDGAVNHSAILPCSLSIPSNQRGNQLHILWFKNFTERLWDCMVRSEEGPDCRTTPHAPRTRISWKFFGNADLEISALQDSDAGHYQCWIILEDAYRRRDVLLRVHGLRREEPGPDTGGPGRGETWFPWTILLLTGWPLAIFLAGLFLARGLFICTRKKKCRLAILL